MAIQGHTHTGGLGAINIIEQVCFCPFPCSSWVSQVIMLKFLSYCSYCEEVGQYFAGARQVLRFVTPAKDEGHQDYIITGYVAEFMNTLTNLIYGAAPRLFHPLTRDSVWAGTYWRVFSCLRILRASKQQAWLLRQRSHSSIYWPWLCGFWLGRISWHPEIPGAMVYVFIHENCNVKHLLQAVPNA